MGVLRAPSFVPGLFLRHAAGAVRQKENPHLVAVCSFAAKVTLALARDHKADVAARLIRHFLLTGDAIHYGVS